MADWRLTLRRSLRRQLFLAIRMLVRWLGFDAMRGLGSALGGFQYRLGPRVRGRCLHDLAVLQNRVPGDPVVARQLRHSYDVYTGAMLEVVAMFDRKLEAAALAARCRIDGVSNLEAARTGGVILLSMHAGNTLLGAAKLASEGWPVTVVYRQSRMMAPGFFAEGLPRYGIEGIQANEGRKAYASMVRALRKNRIVFVMIDQGVKHAKDGMLVRFLGKDMPMPMGPAHLARVTGAPVLPLVTLAADPIWHFEIAAPVLRDADARLEDDVESLVRITERLVMERPQLWSWHQRRWRKFRLAAPPPG